MSSSLAFPKGSTVLVTGVSGFIASHCAEELLKAGFRVRGTVRDDKKAQWIKDYFHERYGQDAFETFIVPDFTVPGAFDEAMKGTTAIAHVASDVSFGYDPNVVIKGVVEATRGLLKAAAAVPSIKRVVLTSSSAAVSFVTPDKKYNLTKETWNDAAVQLAYAPPPYTEERAFPVYAASKYEQEKAAWDFVKTEKPGFVFNAVLPYCTLGPILSSKQSGSTAGWARDVYEGNQAGADTMKLVSPQWMVNAKDVALLHLAALSLEEVQNERIFAYGEPFNFNDIVDGFRELRPDATTICERIEDNGRDLTTVDLKREIELLGVMGKPGGFTGLKESLKQILEASG